MLVDCVTYCVLRLRRPRRRRRVDPLHRRLGRRRRPRRDPRIRRRRSTRSRAASKTRSTRRARAARTDAVAARRPDAGVARPRSVGAAAAPMIGQARPADRATQRARAWLAAGRLARVGAHAAPDRTEHTASTAPPALARRRGRALPPPSPRPPRAVAHAVNAPRELIEDACQTAWTIMLRSPARRATRSSPGCASSPSTRPTGSARSSAATSTSRPSLPDGTGTPSSPTRVSIDDILEAREALRCLAGLPERQRADLTLLVAGFSYREIAADDRRAHATPTSTSTSPRPAPASDSRGSPTAPLSAGGPRTDRFRGPRIAAMALYE